MSDGTNDDDDDDVINAAVLRSLQPAEVARSRLSIRLLRLLPKEVLDVDGCNNSEPRLLPSPNNAAEYDFTDNFDGGIIFCLIILNRSLPPPPALAVLTTVANNTAEIKIRLIEAIVDDRLLRVINDDDVSKVLFRRRRLEQSGWLLLLLK